MGGETVRGRPRTVRGTVRGAAGGQVRGRVEYASGRVDHLPPAKGFCRPVDRDQLKTELLEELVAHSPAAAMRDLRRWPGGPLSLVHLHVLTVLDVGRADPDARPRGEPRREPGERDRDRGPHGAARARDPPARRRGPAGRPRRAHRGGPEHGQRHGRRPPGEAGHGPRRPDRRRAGRVPRRRPRDAPRPRAPPRTTRRGARRRARGTDGDRASSAPTCRATAGRSSSSSSCCSSRRSPTCTCPTLNADIINNGVATGDTDYILADRRVHARGDLRR